MRTSHLVKIWNTPGDKDSEQKFSHEVNSIVATSLCVASGLVSQKLKNV